MTESTSIILFPLYRWSGTTPEAFRDHYVNVHAAIGKRLGVTWYETFLNKNAHRDWPVLGDHIPDAFTIMRFPSDEALEKVRNTAVWEKEVLEDCIGFVSHAPAVEVDRFTWIPEPERRGAERCPIVVFPVYRWPGTTFEAFRAHYIGVHSKIGKRLPGVIWYESFLNRNAHAGWPVFGAPVPDAFAVMMFESDAALANVRNTPQWEEAAKDDIGFVSHAQVVETERITWIADPTARQAFGK